MRRILWALVPVALAILGGCRQQQARQATVAAPATIAWREGDVEDAFREAKESGKPVLLYWGAKWCPPCNAMKATIFKDPDFVRQTRAFVPVHLDGDDRGAQRWGERFGISGYPTVIIMRPDRTEIARLASDAPARLAATLRAAAARTVSIDALLRTALADPATLTRDDWTILSSYDWFNDPGRFADGGSPAPLLAKLAAAAPDPALRRHFALAALAARADAGRTPAFDAATQRQAADLVSGALAADQGRDLALADRYAMVSIVQALPRGPQRSALAADILAANGRLVDDPRRPLSERATALTLDVALAKAEGGKALPAQLAAARRLAAWTRANVKDPVTLQASAPDIAEAMGEAGDPAGATRFVEAGLPHALSPSYAMGVLSELATMAGDKRAAVDWARRAYEAAEGPATRVGLAIEYGKTAIEAAPTDTAAVAKSGDAVLYAVNHNTGGFRVTTGKRLRDWSRAFAEWARAHDAEPVLARFRSRIGESCASQGDGNAKCQAFLTA